MSGARITVDGLWRCLCPSIDAAALATAISVPYRPRRPGRIPATTTCAALRPAPRRRHLHTAPRKLQDGSAEKKAEPPALRSDADSKANKEPRPKPTDFGDRRPTVKIDQESTDAWKRYFDVVLVDGRDAPRDSNLDMSKNAVRGSSPGMVDAEAKNKDLSDESFGAAEKKQQCLPNKFGDAGEDPFDESSQGTVGKDAFNLLIDAENQQQHKALNVNELGEGTFPTAAGTGAENAPSVGSSNRGQSHGARTPANEPGMNSSPTVAAPSSTESIPSKGDATNPQSGDGASSKWGSQRRGNKEVAERLLQMKPPFTDVPPEATKEDVLTALTFARMRGPRKYRRITATLLRHLLKMDSKPTAFHYDLLFRAHCLPEGSADVIGSLLQEMRQERVHWSSNTYHSVLRALTIHPDYLMRNVILREMKERWLDIMPKGHRFIALGLLRDEQYEMALEKLESMIQQGIEVDPWVFDIFIYVFGKLEFLDDALRLVRHRLDRGFEISVNIWYFLLDVCSKGQNHQATTYIWNRTVQQGIVNPSDGVALNILNMASVYGDTDLATQVIQYLAERGTKLSRPHYEALADAYSMQGQVERAIEVYCIMHGAGAEVNQASAGTLCQSLGRDPSRIDKAVEAMEELKKTYNIPVGVFNAVLNEMVKSSAPTPEQAFVRALDLYRRIREFLPNGPNWETFRNLLWRCTRPDIAQFLAGEMIAFKIRQNLVIIELMFKVHVEHNGPIHRVKAAFYKVAPHFHSDYAPGSRRWQNIMDLSVKLVRRLIAERDPEAWRILDICRRNGLEEETIKKLREEVEAGKLATVEAPPVPDADDEASQRPRQS